MMQGVMMQKSVSPHGKPDSFVKEKVCAYARVSTKDREQLSSFENQLSFFSREFVENNRFEFVRLYSDCGKSGTRLSRPGFDEMIRDAGIDKSRLDGDLFSITGPSLFRRIIVKNTSRFARNVSSDLLLKTLSANGVFVDFLDTNLSTERPGDILTLQVFQAMDEHESRDKSRKVLWGMEEGIRRGHILTNSSLYGYRYYPKPENRLEIISGEAENIRLIFDLYLEGLGALCICHELEKRGITTRRGKSWNLNSVLKILRNETYTGVGVRHKYTCGALFSSSASTVRRNPEPIRFETDKVPRIIDSDTFRRVQELLNARAKKHLPTKPIGGKIK